MSQTINNPEIPHISAINDGLVPGKMLRIQGSTPSTAQRFNINLQCGPNVSPRDDIALHLSVRPTEGFIARNSLQGQSWGEEQGQGFNPITPGQPFEILILTDQRDYKIAINGKHFGEFMHRIPITKVNHITIDGDVQIKLINFELSAPPPNAPVGDAPPQGAAYGPPSGPPMYGPPPMGSPGAYGQPPYGGPGPYGPPPPPGHNPDGDKGSGLEGFLGQAGAAIAGAFGNAVLQGALSGKQQAQPGAQSQPAPAPQQPLAGGYGGQSVGGLGSIGSFLSSTLADSIQPHHNNQPAQPQQNAGGHGGQSAGGLGSIGAFLSSTLADSIQPHHNNQPAYPPPQQSVAGGHGGQSAGGLGSIGDFLSSTLAETLKPKQKKKHKKEKKAEKKAMKKAQKALQYAVPAAGIGFIGYALHKGLKHKHGKHHHYGHHHGRSSSTSSSSSSSSSDSD